MIPQLCMFSRAVMSDSLKPYGLEPARLLCPQDSPGYEYWSGVPCPPLGDLPNSGIKPPSPSLAGGFFATSTTWEAHSNLYQCTVSLNHRYLIWHIKLIIAPHMYTFTKKENPIENTLKWGKKRSATLPEIQNQAWKPGCRGEGYWWHLLCEV